MRSTKPDGNACCRSLAKAYLAVGQRVVGQRGQDILGASMALFDRQLAELTAFAPTADIKTTYGQLAAAWGDYKALLVDQTPTRERAPALIEMDGKVLALANKGTLQLEQLSGKPVGKLVNIAGRQRMLSQRVAKFYLAQEWGASVPNAQAELDKARAEFVAALDVLAGAPEATGQIKQEIDLARHQWVFYETALAQHGAGAAASERSANVFVSSENILSVMDKVTGMYARLTA